MSVWLGGSADKNGRLVHGALLGFTFVAVVGQLVTTVRGGMREPLAVDVLMLGLIGWSASAFTALVWEHPLGGVVWVVAMPIAALALGWTATTIWFGGADTFMLGTVGGSRLGRALVALYAVVFAITAAIEWARFLMYLRARRRGRDYLGLLGYSLVGVVLLIVIVLAIASHGTESARLVYLSVALGALGLARSARRIMEFVRRFRI
ncbi:hypothetical protein [Labedaea rhizosphaerae]|uniref:hypothetical protein n=1 Tax=Labedaea rhizosphaerae TaxID=598644 RepID=UPI00105CFAC7|nr:hypothetical protein [Labedaea rhizosphaerae]